MTEVTKMPRKRKLEGPFSNELLDPLLAQMKGKDAESLLGEFGLIGKPKKQLAERRAFPSSGGPDCRREGRQSG